MQNRILGNTGIAVSPIMLGGNVFGWTIDEATSFAVLNSFVDRGFNFIDTADIYATWVPPYTGGNSEIILGKWMKQAGNRDKVIVATKVGKPMGAGKEGLSPAYIRSAVEDSLRRLQTDVIDLYQTHEDDQKTPLEDTLRTLQDLVQEGKVRAIGASNYTGQRLREAIEMSRNAGLASYQTLQPNYNLHTREEYERDLAPVVAEFNVGVVPYYSLAAGFLTGKYRSAEQAAQAKRAGTLARFFDERGTSILSTLTSISEQSGAKPATIALAWLLSRPNILAPIASATSEEQLADILAAAELRLTAQQLEELSAASAYTSSNAEPQMADALPVE